MENIIIWYYKPSIDANGLIKHKKVPLLILKNQKDGWKADSIVRKLSNTCCCGWSGEIDFNTESYIVDKIWNMNDMEVIKDADRD